jgi:hypothetical protein
LWLLEHYRQQLQPDVLVICNATAQHEQTAKTAKVLLNWVKETQPSEESALPGLVWAITPHDARFTTRQNLDEAVQHLLGKPGQRWGTLQALDSHSMQRVIEWLSQATLPAQRQKRLRHAENVAAAGALGPDAKLSGTCDAGTRRKTRSGRKHGAHAPSSAARHGELLEGLLPPLKPLKRCWPFSNRVRSRSTGCLRIPLTCLPRMPRRIAACSRQKTKRAGAQSVDKSSAPVEPK